MLSILDTILELNELDPATSYCAFIKTITETQRESKAVSINFMTSNGNFVFNVSRLNCFFQLINKRHVTLIRHQRVYLWYLLGILDNIWQFKGEFVGNYEQLWPPVPQLYVKTSF